MSECNSSSIFWGLLLISVFIYLLYVVLVGIEKSIRFVKYRIRRPNGESKYIIDGYGFNPCLFFSKWHNDIAREFSFIEAESRISKWVREDADKGEGPVEYWIEERK